MKFSQFLGGQGWAEITIMLTDKMQDILTVMFGISMITRLAAFGGNEAFRAISCVGADQTLNLACTDAEYLCAIFLFQPFVQNVMDDLKS